MILQNLSAYQALDARILFPKDALSEDFQEEVLLVVEAGGGGGGSSF